MTYVKTILCLANSRKLSGRCVAGREVDGRAYGNWVRPVSSRPTEEVSEEERRYENGQDPKVLDIVQITMTRHQPKSFQSENHVIDPEKYWVRVGRATWTEAVTATDNIDGPLWTNDDESYNGVNDQVAEAQAATFRNSLYLIKVEAMRNHVVHEGGIHGPAKRRVRGEFEFNGVRYKLAVTDPVIERQYLAKNNGIYDIGATLLCVSLGEIFKGYAYKLIAALITPDRTE